MRTKTSQDESFSSPPRGPPSLDPGGTHPSSSRSGTTLPPAREILTQGTFPKVPPPRLRSGENGGVGTSRSRLVVHGPWSPTRHPPSPVAVLGARGLRVCGDGCRSPDHSPSPPQVRRYPELPTVGVSSTGRDREARDYDILFTHRRLVRTQTHNPLESLSAPGDSPRVSLLWGQLT